MTLTELGALGEFIAAVAVLITLVYLTLQVQQGNALARSQTRQRRSSKRSESFIE